MHIEAIGYVAVQPNTGGAGVPCTGDSLTILNDQTRHANIIDWRAKNQVAGSHQLIFPTAHDTTKNVKVPVPIDNLSPLQPWGLSMQPTAQELLSITVAGSNVAADAELGWLQLHYPDVPGLKGRYIDWPGVLKFAEKECTIFSSMTATAVPPACWVGTELITADSDLLQADRDYAVLGFRTDISIACVALRGPDNSGRRIGCPGINIANDTQQQYFAAQSRAFRMPMIPVIASGNKSNTFFEFLGDENARTVVAAAYLVRLARGWQTRK